MLAVPGRTGRPLEALLRIRFHHAPPPADAPDGLLWFGHSLAYALLHGAHEILEVPLRDLNVTVRTAAGDPLPEVILYDALAALGYPRSLRINSPTTGAG